MFTMIEAEMRIHEMTASLKASKVRPRPADLNAEVPRVGTGRRWESFRRIVEGK